jgi:hypothetical protein
MRAAQRGHAVITLCRKKLVSACVWRQLPSPMATTRVWLAPIRISRSLETL